MRATFNRNIDLYHGPASGTPGDIRESDIPARLVGDVCFVDSDTPLSLTLAYLTMEDAEPIGPKLTLISPGLYTYDFGFADRVSLTHEGSVSFVVYRVETRTWDTGEPYWRAHIGPEFEQVYGCQRYDISPWSVSIYRSTGSSWGEDGDSVLTTDGAGNWELIDVGDDIHYTAMGWDGSGSQMFSRVDQFEEAIVTCGGEP